MNEDTIIEDAILQQEKMDLHLSLNFSTRRGATSRERTSTDLHAEVWTSPSNSGVAGVAGVMAVVTGAVFWALLILSKRFRQVPVAGVASSFAIILGRCFFSRENC